MRKIVRDKKGRYVKGCVSPRKGAKLTQETKEKIRKKLKGKPPTEKTLRNLLKMAKEREGKPLPKWWRDKIKKGQKKGADAKGWKGGRRKSYQGYILVYSPTHPYCDKDKCVKEERLVMEKHIGRVLLPKEVVHHVNSVRDDNRIENLMLFSSNGEHMKYHWAMRRRR